MDFYKIAPRPAKKPGADSPNELMQYSLYYRNIKRTGAMNLRLRCINQKNYRKKRRTADAFNLRSTNTSATDRHHRLMALRHTLTINQNP